MLAVEGVLLGCENAGYQAHHGVAQLGVAAEQLGELMVLVGGAQQDVVVAHEIGHYGQQQVVLQFEGRTQRGVQEGTNGVGRVGRFDGHHGAQGQ